MAKKKQSQTPRRRTVWVWLLLLVVAASITGAVLFWSAQVALVKPLAVGKDGLRIDVASGSSLSHVLRQLDQQGVVTHSRLIRVYARLKSQASIHQGEYMIPAGSNAMDLVARLHRGDVTRYRVTLVEGWTFEQALVQIRGSDRIVQTPAGKSPEAAAAALGIEGNPEGQIFPDTYVYRSGMRDIDVLRQAHKRLQRVLQEEWDARADELPYSDAYEALIMASMVEKETGAPWERDAIAGVFVRRLEKGMRLQTDPTVIYGLGSDYDGNLQRAHLRQATPYNTYVIGGMPPTPIALAGREAIHAALNPKAGDALYFVAKGDGSHQFSATLAEHNQAVRKYQLQRRGNYRSSPSAETQQ